MIFLQKSQLARIIKQFNDFLGVHYDSADIFNLLNSQRNNLIILGIILSGIRFALHLGTLLKHAWQAKKDEELSAAKILWQEFEKRGFILANDLVWFSVTLLTFCNEFFHIAAKSVPIIIFSFLLFDALSYMLQAAFEAYKFHLHKEELILQQMGASDKESALIQRQLDVLQDGRDKIIAGHKMNFLGASLIALGFGGSLVCVSLPALAGLSLLGMLGNAVYNSAAEYRQYQSCHIAKERELANGSLLNDAQHQKLMKHLYAKENKAYNAFLQAMAFNTAGTSFFITALAISWPLALSLSVLYLGANLYKAHSTKPVAALEIDGGEPVYRFL